MTLDQLQQRDRRIAELEAIGSRCRSCDEDAELHRLQTIHDLQWRRLPEALARARRRAAELEAWGRQHNLQFS